MLLRGQVPTNNRLTNQSGIVHFILYQIHRKARKLMIMKYQHSNIIFLKNLNIIFLFE